MRIVKVCPECGSDIECYEICTDPPIPVRRCMKCSWKWEGKPEETVRVPFNPEGYGQGEYELKVPTIVTVHMNT